MVETRRRESVRLSEARVPTPSQTVGPFFGFALPFETGHDAASGEQAVRIEGQLFDGAGEPVTDGLLELSGAQQFARCRTDAEGLFHFNAVKPAAAPPPGGEAPHLDVTIFARGLLRHLVTRMYFPDEAAANARDRILNLVDADRRDTLIAHSEGAVLRFDSHLQGESETVFFAF